MIWSWPTCGVLSLWDFLKSDTSLSSFEWRSKKWCSKVLTDISRSALFYVFEFYFWFLRSSCLCLPSAGIAVVCYYTVCALVLLLTWSASSWRHTYMFSAGRSELWSAFSCHNFIILSCIPWIVSILAYQLICFIFKHQPSHLSLVWTKLAASENVDSEVKTEHMALSGMAIFLVFSPPFHTHTFSLLMLMHVHCKNPNEKTPKLQSRHAQCRVQRLKKKVKF